MRSHPVPRARIHDRVETRSRRRWLLFISAFFAAQAVLWTTALTLVSGDPSHAVVSDYAARARDWDEHRAQLARSAALGWEAAIDVDALDSRDPDLGASTVRLRLTDRQQRAVEAAQVEVTLFHYAAAAHPQQLALVPEAPGVYLGAARIDRKGKWRFEVRASRGDDVFTHTESRVLGQD